MLATAYYQKWIIDLKVKTGDPQILLIHFLNPYGLEFGFVKSYVK